MSARRFRLTAAPHGSLRLLLVVVGLCASVGVGCRAQNSGDTPGGAAGVPSASFSQSATAGEPGLLVQFNDTSTGAVTAYAWDFGNGETSALQHPQVRYMNEGSYSVTLTVSNARGESTRRVPQLIQVARRPTAGFSCAPQTGFVPHTIVCTSTTAAGASLTWDFGDGTTSFDRNPSHRFDAPGSYTVDQIAATAGGQDTASTVIDVLPISISASPPSGASGGDFVLTANVGTLAPGLETWFVGGNQILGSGRSITASLRQPGTYHIDYFYANQSLGLVGQTSLEYVVTHAPVAAAFRPSETEGAGPLTVVLNDESVGEVTEWEWDFGDGESCVYPAPAGGTSGGVMVCNASSPSHVYRNVGRYDVRLRVAGRSQPGGLVDSTDSVSIEDAVSVTIVDPSFENQTVGGEIAGGWTVLRPASATATAQHVALSNVGSPGSDAGMPSDGRRWASLDGLGTNGSTPVDLVENGIRQEFLRPAQASVLEFDFAFLYSEPPASGVLDALTATVSDGTAIVEIPSARVDVSTPYAGRSLRYPTLDGGTTRVTPVHTASLDLATAFPGAPADTRYTLTIRLTNATNGFRSPRAYVDHVRFSAPGTQPTPAISVDPTIVVAGQPARFSSGICPAIWNRAEALPRTWRWDFDTQTSTTPPASSGSNEQCPSYAFAEAGDYLVSVIESDADRQSVASRIISVLEAPLADFEASFAGGNTLAPATILFDDLSTSDPLDPIVAWSWDFGGWGTSQVQSPPAVRIGQSGDWLIRLTITTSEGLTDTFESLVTVD